MIRGCLQLYNISSCNLRHDGEVASSDTLDWQYALVWRSGVAGSLLACYGDVLCQCDPAVCSDSVLLWSGGAAWFDGLTRSLITWSDGVRSSA
jgi:hypothetical protein